MSTTTARRAPGHVERAAWDDGGRGISLPGLHRARILAALSEMVAADGIDGVSVTQVVRKARVSRGAFYGHFDCLEDALGTLVENALERSRADVLQASAHEIGWEAKTRAALTALLELYEAEPEVGRLCLIHSRHPRLGIERTRRRLLGQLARHVAEGSREGRRPASALSAECTVAGVLGVLEESLGYEGEPQLTDLAGELMSFIVMPYRGASFARAERARAMRLRKPLPLREEAEASRGAGLRITYRTIRVLATIASTPGLSNAEVAEQSGIADQGQISKLLKRLRALGLVENTGGGQELGAANAWRLTDEGHKIERSILEHHAPARREGR